MPAVEGIDIAWDRPTVAEIKAAGAHWVARYFSPDASKNLTAAEVKDYQAAGLPVVTVYESTATRATQSGKAGGVADAQLAEQQRAAAGLPADHVQHFAVDQDATWEQVAPYFEGVVSNIHRDRVGVYGGLKVIEGAYGAGFRFLWQTVAWSDGTWSEHATIRQSGGTVLQGGADVDLAEVPNFGQSPTPIPAPVPVPSTVEETMLLIVYVDRAGYPDPKDWPGEFLLTGAGTLHHISLPADLAALQSAGVKGPIKISDEFYASLLAGK